MNYEIPGRTNLVIACVQLAVLASILWAAGQVRDWGAVLLLSVAYGVAMNSAYAMLHEAEHGLLHPNGVVNDAIGIALTLFFPAPFHLIRQGHLGHHIRNRSDDEAFDLYFEGEKPFWKFVQLYGTLTGAFWALIALANLVVVFNPSMRTPRAMHIDRTTDAFLESLNPKYQTLIRIEALAAIGLHAALIYFWQIPLLQWLAVMFGFGFSWSALQYAHHYGTVRDVRKGAMNLKTFAPLDLILLNHNWHLNHHMHPTVPWTYLPLLSEPDERRGDMFMAVFREWRGPRFSTERVENRYAGRIIH